MSVDLKLFDALRRPTFERAETGYTGTLFFLLRESADGWWLQAVDKKKQSVSPNYRAYNGRERERVKAYQLALSEEEPTFHWGLDENTPISGVMIARHSDLLTTLLNSDQLVDESMHPLAVAAERHSLTLRLEPLETEDNGSTTSTPTN